MIEQDQRTRIVQREEAQYSLRSMVRKSYGGKAAVKKKILMALIMLSAVFMQVEDYSSLKEFRISNGCHQDEQFPLNFGDGTTADFSVDLFDLSSDFSMFIFGGSQTYVPPNSILPVVGCYVPGDPQVTVPFLSWLVYFSSSSSITGVEAIALSPDAKQAVVGFSNNFGFITLNTTNGWGMGSAVFPASADLLIPERGVTMDSAYRPIEASIQLSSQNVFINRYNSLYTSFSYYQITGSRSLWGVKYRPSDDVTFILGNLYTSIVFFGNFNALSLMKLDGSTGIINEYRYLFSTSVVSNSVYFKHLDVTNNHVGGCFSQGAGFFYFDDSTQNLVFREYFSSNCVCLGFWVRSDTDLGYLYEIPSSKNQIRIAHITNALTQTSPTTYLLDYSATDPTLNIKSFYRFSTTDHYVIGNIPGSTYLIGYIGSYNSAFTCSGSNLPPQQSMSSFTLTSRSPYSSSSTSYTMTSSTSLGTSTVMAVQSPSSQRVSVGCSSAPVTRTIVAPVSYPTAWTCFNGVTCTVTIGTFSLSSPLSLCSGSVSLSYDLFCTTDSTYFLGLVSMSGDLFKYTYTPVAAQLGTKTYQVRAWAFVNGNKFAFDYSVQFSVTVIDCLLANPSPVPSSFSCTQDVSCTLSYTSPHIYTNAACIGNAPPIVFTLLDTTNSVKISYRTSMASDIFSLSFTPTFADVGTHTYQLVAESYKTPGQIYTSAPAITFSVVVSTPPCTTNLVIAPPAYTKVETYYTVGQNPVTQTFNAFTFTPTGCGTLSYTGSLTGPTGKISALPTFINFKNTVRRFTASTTSLADVGTYNVTITAQVPPYTVQSSLIWILHVVPQVVTQPSNLAPYFSPDPIQFLTVKCNQAYQYSLPKIIDNEGDAFTVKMTVTTASGGVAQLATLKSDYSAILFSPVCRGNFTEMLTLKLTDKNPTLPKTSSYSITISTLYYTPGGALNSSGSSVQSGSGSYQSSSTFSNPCKGFSKLTSEGNGVPVEKQLQVDVCALIFPDITIYALDQSTYLLPPQVLQDESSYLDVRTREIQRFGKFIENERFALNPLEKDKGIYQIVIKVLDKSSMVQLSQTSFKIIVESASKNPKAGGCPFQDAKRCLPRISKISMEGLVTIQFPMTVKSFSQEFYRNITESLFLEVQRQEIEGQKKVRNVSITSWNVTDFQSQSIILQVVFSNPLEISISEGYPDKLQVKFLNNEYFQTYDGRYKLQTGTILDHDIPQQFDTKSSTAKKTQAVFQVMESGMTGSLVVNFFLAAFMGIAMKQIWGIINTLQILTFLPIMVTTLPSNLQVCLKILEDVSNLNIIPKSVVDYVKSIFDYFKDDPISERFLEEDQANSAPEQTQKKSPQSLFDNIGYIILGATAFGVILLLILIMLCLSKSYPRFQKLLLSIKQKILFGVFITTILRGYLKMSFSFTSQVSSSTAELAQVIFPLILLVGFSMIPFAIYFFLLYNRWRLHDPTFFATFGALYQNLSLTKIGHNRSEEGAPFRYCFYVLFLLRRLIFAVSLCKIFIELTLWNVMLQLNLSLALLIYLILFKPFELSRDNWIEMTNEFTILFAYYLCLGIITDDTQIDGVTKQELGYAMIALVLLNITINLAIFLYTVFNILKLKCRGRCQRKQRQQEAKTKTVSELEMIDIDERKRKLEPKKKHPSKAFELTPSILYLQKDNQAATQGASDQGLRNRQSELVLEDIQPGEGTSSIPNIYNLIAGGAFNHKQNRQEGLEELKSKSNYKNNNVNLAPQLISTSLIENYQARQISLFERRIRGQTGAGSTSGLIFNQNHQSTSWPKQQRDISMDDVTSTPPYQVQSDYNGIANDQRSYTLDHHIRNLRADGGQSLFNNENAASSLNQTGMLRAPSMPDNELSFQAKQENMLLQRIKRVQQIMSVHGDYRSNLNTN